MIDSNIFDLKDKVAIVTGGSGYLGKSFAEALVESGADVYITSRNKENCDKVVLELQKLQKGKIHSLELDILSLESVKNCFQQVIRNSGRIDILVNNASYMKTNKSESVTEEEWLSGIDGTINGVFRCTSQAIPIMAKNETSSIINIASIYGQVSPDPSIYDDSGYNSPPQYGAGKAAIIQYTKYMACHLAQKNIRVNAISPGPFPKPDVQQNTNFMNNLKKKIPLGRVGNPSELKGVMMFLASNASSFVTGENIHVDGGWSAC